MKSHIIRAVLATETPATSATMSVALGLLNTLALDVAKELQDAQRALGQRRRQRHDDVLAEAVLQAESIAYVARWISSRLRAARHDEHLPVVITGLDEQEPSALQNRDPLDAKMVP